MACAFGESKSYPGEESEKGRQGISGGGAGQRRVYRGSALLIASVRFSWLQTCMNANRDSLSEKNSE
jgi:hypothetical protein